jgi:menaquinone-9 beta-reductase
MGLEMADNYSEIDCDVLIIGGGLAGLTAAILIGRAGINVLLVEKKSYPFHKVCGEYVSNEVKPFLAQIGINFSKLLPSSITHLEVLSRSGKIEMKTPLPLGGFGISRFRLDYELYHLAIQSGVKIFENNRVMDIAYHGNNFQIQLSNGTNLKSKLVIGSYGKRDILDNKLQRSFTRYRSDYMAVKYHIKASHPENIISLYYFNGGYCGLNKIEDDKYCLCYLVDRNIFKKFKSVKKAEEQLLHTTPQLRKILQDSTFLYEQPLVINEFSFREKQAVEKHVLMCGDSAGLISPMCGNGMSMAIIAAKFLSELIIESDIKSKIFNRQPLESTYIKKWDANFRMRLRTGKMLQDFSDLNLATGILYLLNLNSTFTQWVISKTHGKKIV